MAPWLLISSGYRHPNQTARRSTLLWPPTDPFSFFFLIFSFHSFSLTRGVLFSLLSKHKISQSLLNNLFFLFILKGFFLVFAATGFSVSFISPELSQLKQILQRLRSPETGPLSFHFFYSATDALRRTLFHALTSSYGLWSEPDGVGWLLGLHSFPSFSNSE